MNAAARSCFGLAKEISSAPFHCRSLARRALECYLETRPAVIRLRKSSSANAEE